MELKKLPSVRGFEYVRNIVDCYSRFAMGAGIMTKSAKDVCAVVLKYSYAYVSDEAYKAETRKKLNEWIIYKDLTSLLCVFAVCVCCVCLLCVFAVSGDRTTPLRCRRYDDLSTSATLWTATLGSRWVRASSPSLHVQWCSSTVMHTAGPPGILQTDNGRVSGDEGNEIPEDKWSSLPSTKPGHG